jgi:hypothetical protein
MHEIESVKGMQDTAYIKTRETGTRELESENGLQQVSTKADKVFQIKTTADGYNSGRIYYLRVPDDAKEDLCGSIIQFLQKSAQAARKRMEVISQFERIQKYLRKVHDSVAFQTLVGVLICAVCSLHHSMLLPEVVVYYFLSQPVL